MVDTPIDRPRRIAAVLCPYVMPALQHGGWFGLFLILAPAIGPRGYGVFILALGGIAILSALLAKSTSHVLVTVPTLDDRHWSTALVTLMIVGVAAGLIISVIAGAVATIADEPSFGDLFRSLAALPLLEALAVVPSAALRREQRTTALLAASAAGLAAGGGLAISLAWAGAGAWSLVAQIIVQRLVECAMLWGIPGAPIGIAWSPRHLAELTRAADLRALAAAMPTVQRYGPCLAAGAVLGPTAAGLYMLAARLGEGLAECLLAGMPKSAESGAAESLRRAALPAVLASLQLAVALPPVLDLRWWGAVEPAQILVLGALPSALICVHAARADFCGAPWRAVQAMGMILLTTLVATHGLVAIAVASLLWTSTVALAGMRPLRVRSDKGRRMLSGTVRPCLSAAAAGGLLFVLAEPVGLGLAPVPALCLLTGIGWLVYLVMRGESTAAPRTIASPAGLAP